MKYPNSLAIVALGLTLASPAIIANAGASHAPPISLAQSYNDSFDPAKYLVSEKFDGARAWWNGRHLLSRGGYIYHAPQWFTKALPNHALDGELWIGRGQFQQLMSTIRDSKPNDIAWRSVRYMVFDAPEFPGTFNTRQQHLTSVLKNNKSAWIKQVTQHRVENKQALQSMLLTTVANGAEGLILQRADSPYRVGRHDGMLKFKLHEDAEATVVGYTPGKGKYKNAVGSLIVVNSEGIKFRLGSGLSDKQRDQPPPVGSKVTYRYQGHTNSGKPRFAVFVRQRLAE